MKQKNRTLTAVIFDQNQVLADYDHSAGAAYFEALLPISYEALGERWERWVKAVGFPTTLAEETRFFKEFYQALSAELQLSPEVQEKLSAFSYISILRPYPDARPALEAVKEAGLKVGVLSNFSFASLHEALTAVGLGELIDVALSSTAIGVAKPDPKAYLHMTQALQVEPDDCLFFDNKMPHIKSAVKLGMSAYLVDRAQAEHHLDQGIVCDLTAVPLLIQQHRSPSRSVVAESLATAVYEGSKKR